MRTNLWANRHGAGRWIGVSLTAMILIGGFSRGVIAGEQNEFDGPAWVQIALHSQDGNELPESLRERLRDGANYLASAPNESHAESMLKLMDELIELDRQAIANHVGLAVFHSEAPATIRQRAFARVYKDRPQLLAGDIQEVVIQAPNITCHGRFQDSLRDHIRNQHDWVYAVRVELMPQAYDATGGSQHLNIVNSNWPIPSTLAGRMTKITFVIDSKATAEQLAEVLVDSRRYAMNNWKISHLVPLESILQQAGPPSENTADRTDRED